MLSLRIERFEYERVDVPRVGSVVCLNARSAKADLTFRLDATGQRSPFDTRTNAHYFTGKALANGGPLSLLLGYTIVVSLEIENTSLNTNTFTTHHGDDTSNEPHCHISACL